MKAYVVLISALLFVKALGLESSNKPCQLSCSEKHGLGNEEAGRACSRGCRFSAMNQLLNVGPVSDAKAQCESSCKNAYADDKMFSACKEGCQNQGILSPIAQMLEAQPGFAADPFMEPDSFFNSISTFMNDFSSTIFNNRGNLFADKEGSSQPFGVVRVFSFPGEGQGRVVSVKLSNKDEPLNDIGFEPFFGDVRSDYAPPRFGFEENKESVRLSSSPSSKCHAPLYDSLSGFKCRAYIPRWQFNPNTGTCEQFIFGGCPNVQNMFSSQDECQTVCGHLYVNPSNGQRRTRGFELWLLLFCFGALGVCALLGAVSSACMYCYRRKRQRLLQGNVYMQPHRGSSANEMESKIFLIAPQMGWNDGKASSPPTYQDVLKAAQLEKSEKVDVEEKIVA